MANVTIMYLLSEEGRKNNLLAGGSGKERQEVVGEFTKKIKDLASVNSDGEAFIDLTDRVTLDVKGVDCNVYRGEVKFTVERSERYFDKTKTFDELIDFELSRLEKIKKQKENLQDDYREALLEVARAEEKEREEAKKLEKERAILELEKKEFARKRKEEKEEEKKSILKWIDEKGSSHLKDTVELGYEYKRTFIQEYVDEELYEFSIDFDNDSTDYDEKYSPSERAINMLKELLKEGYDAKICVDMEDEDEEIMVIDLYGYTLVSKI